MQDLINILNTTDDNILENISYETIEIIKSKLENNLNQSKMVLQKTNLKELINFTLWNDVWNKYGIYGSLKKDYRNKSAKNTYKKGRFLYIDYGHHNIGKEFSFSHIGIVLKDFGDFIVVVPVTSNKGQIYPNGIKDVVVPVKKADYNQFDKDSYLLIHQIISLGKNRIKRDLGKSIKDTALMNEIEIKVSETFARYVSNLYEDRIDLLCDTITSQNEEIANLKHIIDNLEKKEEQIALSEQ